MQVKENDFLKKALCPQKLGAFFIAPILSL
jgi:hypothetical protein